MATYLVLFLIFTTSAGLTEQPPRAVCKYDRIRAMVRRVKAPTHPSLDLRVTVNRLHAINPLTGSDVSVSREEHGWSCVTGTVSTLHGPEVQSGWLETSRLESLP